jgi:hypothetical protein
MKSKRYTLAELESLPTLSSTHFLNQKVANEEVEVWLSRMTVADGAPYDH